MGVKFKICEFDTSLSFQNIVSYSIVGVFLIFATVMLGAVCFAITYTFNKKYMRAAFKNNKIVIAIDARKDLFSMTEMNRRTTEQTFNTMFEEILSVLELIRELKLNQKLGL